MGVKLEQQGQRIYLVGLPFAAKDEAKRVLSLTGRNFDTDRKQWWCGLARRAQAEKFVATLEAEQTPPGAAPVEKPKEDPDKIRLYGKCRYKGRLYYARYIGKTARGYSCRLVTMDGSLDFWARCAEPHETEHDGSGEVAVVVKTYPIREYRGQQTYTTLGSIRKFIERQKNPDTRTGQCTECGSKGPFGESCRDCGGEGSYC